MIEQEMQQPRTPNSGGKSLHPYHTPPVGYRTTNKPPVHILAISLLSIFTYIGAYIVDIILLDLYFSRREWVWFVTTLTFILIPSIVVQLFSCKWFNDDGDLNASTFIMHVLFLGPVERYWNVFVYGLNTPRLPEQTSFQKKYLTNWRDVCMLRFFYPFIEIGPQITLQLYILLHYIMSQDGGPATNELYAAILVKVLVSVISFPIGLISFNDDLKASHGTKLSACGYACQITYRLLLLASRIITVVLFTWQFKMVAVYVLLVHWCVMIYWVKTDNPNFFAKHDGKFNGCLQALFKLITGFIYIFSYITTNFTDNRCIIISQIIYYGLFFMENISMMVAWVMLNGRNCDYFEVISTSAVFLTTVLGIIFMTIYYKVFQPNIQKSNVADTT